MKDQTKIIAALFAGAAVGAALGLLLAPSSGSGLREDIADYVNDLVGSAKDKASNLRKFGENAIDRSKSKFRSTIDDLADYKDDVIDKAKSKANHVAEVGKEAIDHAKSRAKGSADDVNDSIQNA